MDKLLFFARNDIISGKSSTGEKVLREYETLKDSFDTYLVSQLGTEILLTHNDKTKVVFKCKNKNQVLRKSNEIVIYIVKKFSIPNVYIRYPKSNPIFIRSLRILRKLNCRIVIELPTYPYDSEISTYGKGFRNHIIFYVDRLYRGQLKKYVYRFATYSNHKMIMGVPTVKIVNGIFVDNIKPRKAYANSGDIHIIAVAEMQRSHGYDRFINGLYRYYSSGGKRNIYLHLVGEGSEKKNYEALVDKYHMHENIIFHGYCTGELLDTIFDQCDIALECLAGHRSNLKLSSSLKSREYLAKGIPFVTGMDIDILNESFKYVLRVPADESNVDIQRVVDFHDSIYRDGAEHLISGIREYAKRYCDMATAMEPIKRVFYE